mmetsp:Transcript_82777/g.208396  ORF Transcript_82777/g.208396 Transcript_82777/m.208396 type:complete len:210 (-) Transcript_82777:376-1005(-)
MSAALMQQGSCGAMRDLDYINPRPKVPSSALPPEVRRRLGLGAGNGMPRSSSAPPPESEHASLYTGASNAAPKVGASGAGTAWHNPNGHAFVRRGSGIPMSQRASRKAQLEGPRASLVPAGLEAPSAGGGARAPSRERRSLPPPAPGLEKLAGSVPTADAGSRPSSRESAGGGYGGQRASSRDRRRVPLHLPPKAPVKAKSLPGEGAAA